MNAETMRKLRKATTGSFVLALAFTIPSAYAEYYVVTQAPPTIMWMEKTRYVKPHHKYKCATHHYKKAYYPRPRRSSYQISVTYVWRVVPTCGCGEWIPERWNQSPYYSNEYSGDQYYQQGYESGTPVRYHRNYSSSYYRDETVDQDQATGDDEVMDDPNMNNQY